MNDSSVSMLSTDANVIQQFAVLSRQDCYYLQSSDGADFAIVHSRTATALRTLHSLSIRLEAVFATSDTDGPSQHYKKGKKTVFAISVNIYGPEDVVQEVGRRLSKARTYLQHPIQQKSEIPYKNPHFYALPGVQKAELAYIPPSSGWEDQRAPVVDIDKVFEVVEHTRRLPSQNADGLVKTPLLEYGPAWKGIIRD